jgi:hypothetical protein
MYLKSELKSDSFDVSIGIKIPFFRVSVTIELGRSLLTVRYRELFDVFLKFRMTEENYLRSYNIGTWHLSPFFQEKRRCHKMQ